MPAAAAAAAHHQPKCINILPYSPPQKKKILVSVV